ncbi:MAG: autotransporter outer membrane beta-barrel domain-containing protein [Gammaproteobacteria bacterium]|nr:MAG: autotransporter outer membrane beta-barrel domain-containing protein [Gammaproteobacteria bacterium]
MKRILLSAILACSLSLPSFQSQASPGIMSQLLSECVSQHILNSGNNLILAQIEALCSASNPAISVVMPVLVFSARTAYLINMGVPPRAATVTAAMTPFSARDGEYLTGDGRGMNAGGSFDNIGVWLSATGGVTDNDFVFTPFDNTNRGVQAGVDFTPTESSLLGVSVGYSHDDTETPFNGGDLDTDTFTGMLYGAMALGQNFSVDATLGYSDISTDERRLAAGVAGFTSDPFRTLAFGTPISGEIDASRWFGTLNLNGFWTIRHLLLEAQLGYLHSETNQDSFTETGGGITATARGETYSLSQWHVGATVGYDFGTFLEPYAGVDYSYDISREEVRVAPGLQQPANDRSEMLVRLGMRYFGDNGISGALEWSTNALRQDIDSNTLLLNLRIDL